MHKMLLLLALSQSLIGCTVVIGNNATIYNNNNVELLNGNRIDVNLKPPLEVKAAEKTKP